MHDVYKFAEVLIFRSRAPPWANLAFFLSDHPVRLYVGVQFMKLSDQFCFVGVQLVISSIFIFFSYQILLNNPYHSCTHTDLIQIFTKSFMQIKMSVWICSFFMTFDLKLNTSNSHNFLTILNMTFGLTNWRSYRTHFFCRSLCLSICLFVCLCVIKQIHSKY